MGHTDSLRVPSAVSDDVRVVRMIEMERFSDLFLGWDFRAKSEVIVQQFDSDPGGEVSCRETVAAIADHFSAFKHSGLCRLRGKIDTANHGSLLIWENDNRISLREALNHPAVRKRSLTPQIRLYLCFGIWDALSSLAAQANGRLRASLAELDTFPSLADILVSPSGEVQLWLHRATRTDFALHSAKTAAPKEFSAHAIISSLLALLLDNPAITSSSDKNSLRAADLQRVFFEKKLPPESLLSALATLESDPAENTERALAHFFSPLALYSLRINYVPRQAQTELVKYLEPAVPQLRVTAEQKVVPKPVPKPAPPAPVKTVPQPLKPLPQKFPIAPVDRPAIHVPVSGALPRPTQLALRRARRQRNQRLVFAAVVLCALVILFFVLFVHKDKPQSPPAAAPDTTAQSAVVPAPNAAVPTESPAVSLPETRPDETSSGKPVEAPQSEANHTVTENVVSTAEARRTPPDAIREALTVLEKKRLQADFLRTLSDYIKLHVLQLQSGGSANSSFADGAYGAFFAAGMLEDLVFFDGASYRSTLTDRTYHPDELRNKKCVWFASAISPSR
jgi:hypothetical protein